MLLNAYMFYTLFGSEKNKKTKQKNTTKTNKVKFDRYLTFQHNT